eukprot:jgi/Bigna1/84546/fgenesh1_pg.153_\
MAQLLQNFLKLRQRVKDLASSDELFVVCDSEWRALESMPESRNGKAPRGAGDFKNCLPMQAPLLDFSDLQSGLGLRSLLSFSRDFFAVQGWTKASPHLAIPASRRRREEKEEILAPLAFVLRPRHLLSQQTNSRMSKRIGDESGESVHKVSKDKCLFDHIYAKQKATLRVLLRARLRGNMRRIPLQIFVKPRDKPHLSDFCTRLTGISQQQVDAGISLTAALHKIHGFLASHGLVEGKYEDHCLKPGQYHSDTGSWQYKFAFLTDGPWDLWRFLNPECQRKHIRKAGYYDMWVNVRYLFCEYHEIHRANIASMLQHYKLEFQGAPHSGLDDSKNIARIAKPPTVSLRDIDELIDTLARPGEGGEGEGQGQGEGKEDRPGDDGEQRRSIEGLTTAIKEVEAGMEKAKGKGHPSYIDAIIYTRTYVTCSKKKKKCAGSGPVENSLMIVGALAFLQQQQRRQTSSAKDITMCHCIVHFVTACCLLSRVCKGKTQEAAISKTQEIEGDVGHATTGRQRRCGTSLARSSVIEVSGDGHVTYLHLTV